MDCRNSGNYGNTRNCRIHVTGRDGKYCFQCQKYRYFIGAHKSQGSCETEKYHRNCKNFRFVGREVEEL
jgi:hypothetical protein